MEVDSVSSTTEDVSSEETAQISKNKEDGVDDDQNLNIADSTNDKSVFDVISQELSLENDSSVKEIAKDGSLIDIHSSKQPKLIMKIHSSDSMTSVDAGSMKPISSTESSETKLLLKKHFPNMRPLKRKKTQNKENSPGHKRPKGGLRSDCPSFCKAGCTYNHHDLLVFARKMIENDSKSTMTFIEQVNGFYGDGDLMKPSELIYDPAKHSSLPLLHYLALMGKCCGCFALIDAGHSPATTLTPEGETVLHTMVREMYNFNCTHGHMDILVKKFKLLLKEFCACLFQTNSENATPLHLCAESIYVSSELLRSKKPPFRQYQFMKDVFNLLIEQFEINGDSKDLLNMIDKKGNTIAHYLVRDKSAIHLLDLMKKYDVDLSIINGDNESVDSILGNVKASPRQKPFTTQSKTPNTNKSEELVTTQIKRVEPIPKMIIVKPTSSSLPAKRKIKIKNYDLDMNVINAINKSSKKKKEVDWDIPKHLLSPGKQETADEKPNQTTNLESPKLDRTACTESLKSDKTNTELSKPNQRTNTEPSILKHQKTANAESPIKPKYSQLRFENSKPTSSVQTKPKKDEKRKEKQLDKPLSHSFIKRVNTGTPPRTRLNKALEDIKESKLVPKDKSEDVVVTTAQSVVSSTETLEAPLTTKAVTNSSVSKTESPKIEKPLKLNLASLKKASSNLISYKKSSQNLIKKEQKSPTDSQDSPAAKFLKKLSQGNEPIQTGKFKTNPSSSTSNKEESTKSSSSFQTQIPDGVPILSLASSVRASLTTHSSSYKPYARKKFSTKDDFHPSMIAPNNSGSARTAEVSATTIHSSLSNGQLPLISNVHSLKLPISRFPSSQRPVLPKPGSNSLKSPDMAITEQILKTPLANEDRLLVKASNGKMVSVNVMNAVRSGSENSTESPNPVSQVRYPYPQSSTHTSPTFSSASSTRMPAPNHLASNLRTLIESQSHLGGNPRLSVDPQLQNQQHQVSPPGNRPRAPSSQQVPRPYPSPMMGSHRMPYPGFYVAPNGMRYMVPPVYPPNSHMYRHFMPHPHPMDPSNMYGNKFMPENLHNTSAPTSTAPRRGRPPKYPNYGDNSDNLQPPTFVSVGNKCYPNQPVYCSQDIHSGRLHAPPAYTSPEVRPHPPLTYTLPETRAHPPPVYSSPDAHAPSNNYARPLAPVINKKSRNLENILHNMKTGKTETRRNNDRLTSSVISSTESAPPVIILDNEDENLTETLSSSYSGEEQVSSTKNNQNIVSSKPAELEGSADQLKGKELQCPSVESSVQHDLPDENAEEQKFGRFTLVL